MSERYKVIDSTVATFITITIIDWVDLFIRPIYSEILDDALNHCITRKGLRVHAYVYMTSHIHLIASSTENELNDIIRDFKKHTSKEMIAAIKDNPESRREWLLNKFSYAANRINRGVNFKVWKDGFHPVILDTPEKLEQRIKYVHENPMELQLVEHYRHWTNSSYLAYEDEKYQANVKLDLLYR
ncbi:MAG: transposase [Salibacteraceae bacterium]